MDYTEVLRKCLEKYCRQYKISRMDKEPMSRWNHFLLFAHDDVFPERRALLAEPYNNHNLKYGNYSNCDSLSADKVDNICNAYIYLCYENGMEISLTGFCKLTGINRWTIIKWGKYNISDELNCSKIDYYKKCNIYRKLKCEREESLSNKLVSGSGNPVGILAILNRFYGWNISQPRGQPASSKPQSLDAIAAKYGIPTQQADE